MLAMTMSSVFGRQHLLDRPVVKASDGGQTTGGVYGVVDGRGASRGSGNAQRHQVGSMQGEALIAQAAACGQVHHKDASRRDQVDRDLLPGLTSDPV